MKKHISLFLSIVLFATTLNAQVNPRPTIIPAIKEWKGATGRTAVQAVRLDYESSPRTDSLMAVFTDELKALGVNVSTSAATVVKFGSELPSALKEYANAYTLSISNAITINSTTYEGMLYGTRSLLQLVKLAGTQKSIPRGEITDYSTMGRRMLMLDVARTFFPVSVLEQYIRTMAWVKMNELHLHFNDCSWGAEGAYYRLPSEKYPSITSSEHYSWEDIAHIIAFARLYGITVTPEIDTPGHSRALVQVRPELKSPHHPATDQSDTFLAITNPESIEYVATLIGEIIPHFPAPDFHIGTDEYMLKSIKDTVLRNKLGEDFRLYINALNSRVHAMGKNARIWTGFENMPGKTMPDKNITIDMWDSRDARGFLSQGYTIINSSDMFNYIVPGNIIKRYNTDHKYVYENWTTRTFSKDAEKNIPNDAPEPSGVKLNVWNDYGPTGSSMSEIAREVVPSMMTFGDRMWGSRRTHSTYDKWAVWEKKLEVAPLTSFTSENYRKKGIVYQNNTPINMATMRVSTPLDIPEGIKNLEYPWTLEATLLRTARSEKDKEEILLTSGEATLYAYLNHIVRFKNNLQDEHPGVTLVRTQRDAGFTPYTSGLPQVLTFNAALPIATQVKMKIVARHNYTALYIDGVKVGEFNKQSILPLMRLGGDNGNSFKGILQNITIYNYEK